MFGYPDEGSLIALQMWPSVKKCEGSIGAKTRIGNLLLKLQVQLMKMAERVGFEPTVELPPRRISSAVLSTTQPPLRMVHYGKNDQKIVPFVSI